jgi:cytochrome P450
MADLLADPDDYVLSVERYSCSVVSIVGWGRRIDRKDDYIVKIALQMMETITTMQVPGTFWMEAIPELTRLPAWIYPLPSKFRAFGNSFRSYWFALTSEGSEATEPNFAKYLLKTQTAHQFPNDHIAEMTANLIGGGVDTSSSTLISCILGLCVFQEAQLAAQEEIDRVIGQERMPDWPDMEKLPYCQALFKETLRWRSATILGGIPHAPTKDDYYRGYLLPAGIYIAGNLWAIHRDPKDFPEPDTFRPERYLGGNQRPYPNAKGHNAFGWGRRSCSGQPLAEQGLSMAIVKMLWAFHSRPGLDEQVSPPFATAWVRNLPGRLTVS